MAYRLDRTGDAQASRQRKAGTSWTVPYKLVFTDAGNADPAGVMNEAYAIFTRHIFSQARYFNGYAWETYNVTGSAEGPGIYTCTATYGPKGNERERRGKPTVSFSTAAESEHITSSLRTVSATNILGNPTIDWRGLINASAEEVRGCDVLRPKWRHSVTIELLGEFVNSRTFTNLYKYTGSVNDARIWFFNDGELLFTGVDGNSHWEVSEEDGEEVQWFTMTFNFLGSPTTSIERNGYTIYKGGWNYYWTTDLIEMSTIGEKQIPTRKPIQINVEQVYQSKDFSVFNFLN